MRRRTLEMVRFMKNMILIFLASIIAACSSTGNQNQSLIDGYKEELLDEESNHYRIVYEGPKWINKSDAEAQKVIDYTLLRSAELSLDNELPFFIILSNDSETREIIKDTPSCNLNNGDDIDKRKCKRYKSIGDLTLAFIKDPLEVNQGTNIIKDGGYQGKGLFASITVYKVITRKYNMNRNLLFENEMGQQTQTSNAAEIIDWIPIINPTTAQ